MAGLDKWIGAEFKKLVDRGMADKKLTREEFAEIVEEFRKLNPLSKYAVSSWMAGTYPGLEGAVRGGEYENWLALIG
jgi:hypothetical protein